MKFIGKYIGLGLIALGLAIFAVLYFVHLTFVNSLLAIPFTLIVGGCVLHVWMAKRRSRY